MYKNACDLLGKVQERDRWSTYIYKCLIRDQK